MNNVVVTVEKLSVDHSIRTRMRYVHTESCTYVSDMVNLSSVYSLLVQTSSIPLLNISTKHKTNNVQDLCKTNIDTISHKQHTESISYISTKHVSLTTC